MGQSREGEHYDTINKGDLTYEHGSRAVRPPERLRDLAQEAGDQLAPTPENLRGELQRQMAREIERMNERYPLGGSYREDGRAELAGLSFATKPLDPSKWRSQPLTHESWGATAGAPARQELKGTDGVLGYEIDVNRNHPTVTVVRFDLESDLLGKELIGTVLPADSSSGDSTFKWRERGINLLITRRDDGVSRLEFVPGSVVVESTEKPTAWTEPTDAPTADEETLLKLLRRHNGEL